MLLIPYALRGNEIVSIEEVERGLKSGCICLGCGAPLVAKKGERQAHHFAHYRGHNCEHALETALHKRIKALFERSKSIALPAVHLHRQPQAYLPAQLFRYTSVEEEPYLGQLFPDLVLRAGSNQLLLEIAVTHSVPPLKEKKLRRLGLPALELDVLPVYQAHFGGKGAPALAAFEHSLVHGLEHKRWLFNRKQQNAEFRLRKLSTKRQVKHHWNRGYHNYIVSDCPLGKRRWRTGFRQGQAFANVVQDCMHCPRCIQLEHETAYVGYAEVPMVPKAVHCWGDLPPPRGQPWESAV